MTKELIKELRVAVTAMVVNPCAEAEKRVDTASAALLDRLEKAEKDAARLLPLLKLALSVVDGSYSEDYDQGFEELVSAALFTEIQAMEASK
jgi:hypothetical protein